MQNEVDRSSPRTGSVDGPAQVSPLIFLLAGLLFPGLALSSW